MATLCQTTRLEGRFRPDGGYSGRFPSRNISGLRCFGEYFGLHKQERRPGVGPRRRLKGR
jgi:hypothetical protein